VAKKQYRRYNKRIALRLCEHIAMGDTVREAIEKEPLGPSLRGFFYWIEENPEFEVAYEKAKMIRADLAVDEVYSLSRKVLAHPKDANAYKVASEILKWGAEVQNPAKYGSKVEINHRKPMPSPAALRAEIKRLEKELGVREKGGFVDVEAHELPMLPPEHRE
jgi:hypothetical protein